MKQDKRNATLGPLFERFSIVKLWMRKFQTIHRRFLAFLKLCKYFGKYTSQVENQSNSVNLAKYQKDSSAKCLSNLLILFITFDLIKIDL